MSTRIEMIVSRSLLAQRVALRQMKPSAELDERFERSLEAWRTQRLRSETRRRFQWALVAAVTGILVLSTGWLVMHVDERPARTVTRDSRDAQLTAEDPTVLRVRASLGTQLLTSRGNGLPPDRRQYWVDVGVAGDGTLHIERVTPIDDDPQLFVP